MAKLIVLFALSKLSTIGPLPSPRYSGIKGTGEDGGGGVVAGGAPAWAKAVTAGICITKAMYNHWQRFEGGRLALVNTCGEISLCRQSAETYFPAGINQGLAATLNAPPVVCTLPW